MKDIVSTLRHIASYELPSRESDLIRAINEIEDLRSILSKISKTISKAMPSDRVEPNQKILAKWDTYLRLPEEVGGLPRTIESALGAVTDEERALFGGHKMTRRAWQTLREANMLDFDAIYLANVNKLKRMPNTGRKTIAEIARLRIKLLEDRKAEAA